MKKKSIFSKFLSCAIAVTTVLMAKPAATVNAAVTWNNTSDVSWIDSNKKIIAFAFDDGPVNGNTANTILNTLEKYKMHATFFYQGNQINYSNRAEIKRAYNLGCEVASHTYSHPYLTNLSYSQIQDEVNRNANLLKEITGQSKYLIRPPYLATNGNVFNAIDVPLVTCSVDTKDWDGASKDAIIRTVLNAKDGDILLMHETYNTTAQAVEYLVPELINRGFVVTSVSELFKMKGKTMTSGNVYSSCYGPNVVQNNNNNNDYNNNNNNYNSSKKECESMQTGGQYTGRINNPFNGLALYANNDSCSFGQYFNGGNHNFTLRGCSNNNNMARVDLQIDGQTKGTFYYGGPYPAEYTIQNVYVGAGNHTVKLVVTADNGQWDAFVDWLSWS